MDEESNKSDISTDPGAMVVPSQVVEFSNDRSPSTNEDRKPDDLHASTQREETTANGHHTASIDAGQGDIDTNPDLVDGAPQKKKKRSKKPKSKRGLGKPTGFEEYYVDTPLTPAEHAEEQKLYDPSLPFFDRILTAIQRFERTRKLTPERRTIFYRYLKYGSIDAGPNMFQSFSQTDASTEGMDKEQLVIAMAQTSISDDKRDLGTETSRYTVDFTGCLKAFLSRRAPDWFGMETKEQVDLITVTLERFMDYILQHEVCPEYGFDVLKARDLCRRASNELWGVAEAQRRLPGDFNIACSILFGGLYSHGYDGTTYWGPSVPGQKNFVGFTEETAIKIIKFGVAGAASEEVYQDYYPKAMDNTLKVVKIHEAMGFEITAVDSPTQESKDMYKSQSTDFTPVGRVYARNWRNPDAAPEDLIQEEREALYQSSNSPHKTGEDDYVFFIEEDLQKHIFVGMKLEATISKLNCGLWFFDQVLRAYPSFDTWLPNEMMVEWKEPRALRGALDFEENDGEEPEETGDADKVDEAIVDNVIEEGDGRKGEDAKL